MATVDPLCEKESLAWTAMVYAVLEGYKIGSDCTAEPSFDGARGGGGGSFRRDSSGPLIVSGQLAYRGIRLVRPTERRIVRGGEMSALEAPDTSGPTDESCPRVETTRNRAQNGTHRSLAETVVLRSVP